MKSLILRIGWMALAAVSAPWLPAQNPENVNAAEMLKKLKP